MPGSPLVDIRNTYGAMFIGTLVSTVLFGLTIVQTWIYFWSYRGRDSKAFKFFIAWLAVLDTLHTIISSYAVYWYLVLNFGNVENLDDNMWAIDAEVFVSIAIAASVQFYYAKRVYIVSQSIISPIVIVSLVLVNAALGIFFTVRAIALKHFSRFHTMTWAMCVGMPAGALADLLIAAVMCLSLYRKRTGFARTDTIITTLMAYSFNSGLVTSLLAASMAISFVASQTSMIWLAFFWVMSYVNSLLAMLNSRDYVRDRSGASTQDKPVNLSSIRIEPSSAAYGSKSGQAGVSVTVHRSTTLDFSRNKSDHDVQSTFEVAKLDASTSALQHQGQTSESST